MATRCRARLAISVDGGADIHSNVGADEPRGPFAMVVSTVYCAIWRVSCLVDSRISAMARRAY